ncbi:Tyrosine kinase specific for activated [Ceratobasidium sp. AG-Ba]|nr:Tyrosine kinase specific for activated [Ceratobasidium sp. AG-Ba]
MFVSPRTILPFAFIDLRFQLVSCKTIRFNDSANKYWYPGTQISRDIVIDANTPPHVIAGHLTARGCKNLTSKLNSLSITSRPIASGGFGDVYQGELLDGTRVAIKTLRLPASYDPEESVGKLLKRAARELYVWSKCQHINVLPLLGLVEFNSQLRMVSLWIDNGNLPSYIARHSDLDRHALSIQVCEGLVYLHNIGIVHGDLKGSNVLVSDEGIPMINDFGNAVHHGTLMIADTTQKNWNTPQWTAPEVMDERQTGNTREADVYSLGMTILETITGKTPYHEKKSIHAIYLAKAVTKEVSAQPEEYIPSSTQYGRSLWSLLNHCWAYEPNHRPNASGVVMEMRRLGSDNQTKPIGQGRTVHLSEAHTPNIGAKRSLEQCSPASASKRPKHDSPRPALRPSRGRLGIPVLNFLAPSTPPLAQKMGTLHYAAQTPQAHVANTPRTHVLAMPQHVVSTPQQPRNHGTSKRVTGTRRPVGAIPRQASPQNMNTAIQQNPNMGRQSAPITNTSQNPNTSVPQNPNIDANPSGSQAPNLPSQNPSGQWQAWKGQIMYLLQEQDDQSPAQLHFHAIATGGPGHNIESDKWPPRLVNTTGFKALPRPTAVQLYVSPLPFGQIIIDPMHSASDQQKHAVFHKAITAGYSIFYEFPHNPMNPLPPNAQPGSARGLLFFSIPTAPARILFKVFLQQPCPPALCRGGQPAGPGLMGNNTNGATSANGASCSGIWPIAEPGAGLVLPGADAGDDIEAPAVSAGAGRGSGNSPPGAVAGTRTGLAEAGAERGKPPNALNNMLGARLSNPIPGVGLQGMASGDGTIAGASTQPAPTPMSSKRTARELYVWSKCHHPNVLPLLGLVEFNGQLRMLSLWMDNGNLPLYIAKHQQLDRHALSTQVCDGLAYLHNIGIVHGDLKGSNVLVSDEGIPMINDFGNAIVSGTLGFADTTQKNWNTPRWTAPEVIDQRQSGNTQEADVYSLGMTVLETISGKLPYSDLRTIHALYIAKVFTKDIPKRPEEHMPSNNAYGDGLWSLLRSCWAHEPKERPTASQVAANMRTLAPLVVRSPRPDAKPSLNEPSKHLLKRPYEGPSMAFSTKRAKNERPKPISMEAVDHREPVGPRGQTPLASWPETRECDRVSSSSSSLSGGRGRTREVLGFNPVIRPSANKRLWRSVDANPDGSESPSPTALHALDLPRRNTPGQQVWSGEIVYKVQGRNGDAETQYQFHAIAAGGSGYDIETTRWPSRLINKDIFRNVSREAALEIYSSDLPFGQIIVDTAHLDTDLSNYNVFHGRISTGQSIFYEFPLDPTNPLPPNAQPGSARGLLFFSAPNAPNRILFKVFLNQLYSATFFQDEQFTPPELPDTSGTDKDGTEANSGSSSTEQLIEPS